MTFPVMFGWVPTKIDNLLSNPGFETAGVGGADIWASWVETAGDGTLANETTLKHEGSDAAKMTAGAGVNTSIQQNITVVAGKQYKLRFWTRGDGTYGGRYKVYDNDNAANIINLTATGVTGTTYTVVAVSFAAPSGCTSAFVRLQCPSTDTGIAYFDACDVS